MLIDKCIVCGSTKFGPFLTCQDYTVSQEQFNIVSCQDCGFKFTNPRPDDDQIGRYYKSESYVSHSNTKKGIINKIYHIVRSYTLKKKLSLIGSYVSRGTIIDYGCGTGMFLKVCKDAGWKTLGYEPDPDARKMAAEQGLAILDSKRKLEAELKGSKADAITLWHVMEHVADVEETLRFFKTNLSEQGVLIIAVPNHTSFDAQYYKEFWAGYDVPRHLYHFSPDSIKRLLGNAGFKLTETKPMKFDSYYVSMLSESYRTGSMNYLKAFSNGFRSNMRASSAQDYSSVIYIFKKA
ncbi:MAG: class I SAM-dependent methyltransferase [Bacteroidia bacterium]